MSGMYAMSATGVELVDLIARWIHVIAGIMWIGNSLLWNWLDRNLTSPQDGSPTQSPAPIGSIWLLHSGAFYYMEKTLLKGATLPRPLHWFKWQAYATWWSGLVLLVAVYWLGGRAALTDPAVAGLTQGEAVAVGAGGIFVAWLVYEGAHRFVAPRAPRLAALLWVAAVTAIAVAFTQLLNGRAALLHVGAMLGTLMAGNVVFTIMPAQRELVASVAAAKEAAAAASSASARAKRVSIHNNYFVFPVIALMMTSHFSALYGHPRAWLLMALIVATGVTVRHLLNIRFTFAAWRPALAVALLTGVGAIYGVLQAGGRDGAVSAAAAAAAEAESNAPVDFADVRHIIDRRCGACHSAEPSDISLGLTPAGVRFDTPDQIIALAARINERAVVTRTMPPSNKTSITDRERAILGRWISQGAALTAPAGQLPR